MSFQLDYIDYIYICLFNANVITTGLKMDWFEK